MDLINSNGILFHIITQRRSKRERERKAHIFVQCSLCYNIYTHSIELGLATDIQMQSEVLMIR